MRRLVIIAEFCFTMLLVNAQPGMSAPISEDVARLVANNFLNHINASSSLQAIEPVQSGAEQVGYLVQLAPQGYILVAGDDIRVPVKGYSLTADFSELPPPYVQNLLRELEVTTSGTSAKGLPLSDDTNAPFWEYLKQSSRQARNLSYTPDTYLVTTRWSQDTPYNKLNPKVNNQSTLTGCTQTAIAQVLRYHASPATGTGVFSHTWNSQTLSAVMNRPFNWDIMPNTLNGSFPEYQQDEVAALMRDLGIINQASFGTSITSAAFYSDRFSRAFGYSPVMNVYISDPNFFSIIKSEIDNLRPMLLVMPGHMTVADGYASDGTGKKIHVNLGWGGSYDDYYFLDQTNIIGPYSFSPNHVIYYNIQPCGSGECNPYPPVAGTQPPLIHSSLPDLIIDQETTVRIEVSDPEGDDVTLSTISSCDDLQATLSANLLTITPIAYNRFCEVAVKARSEDGNTSKTFKVLTRPNKIYLGTQYQIGGQFANQSEIDQYTAYLTGNVSVSGYRGFGNQAFYLWIKDQNGNTVLGPDASPVSGTLPAGFYTIAASLLSSDGSYYNYDENYSGYTLSVLAEGVTYTVNDLATSLGINFSGLYQCGKKGDVNHDSVVGLDDAILALQISSGSPISGTPCIEASVDGSAKVGVPVSIYDLRHLATE